MTGQFSPTGMHKRGMALIAVLWMVAALAVVVSGVTDTVKHEIRFARQQREIFVKSLRAEAAMVRVLQSLKANPMPPDRITWYTLNQEGVDLWVSVTPLTGYVDLNKAQRPLMRALLKIGAGLPEDQSEAILNAIDGRRASARHRPREVPFEAPEDLMQVPGVSMEIYRTIERFVTTDSNGSGRVNPLACPAELLFVLTDGNAPAAQAFDTARNSNKTNPEIDTSRLNPAYYELASSDHVRLMIFDAPAKGHVLLTKMVDLLEDRKLGQPWRYLN